MITINDLRLNLDGPVGFLLKFPALFHEHCSDGKKLRFANNRRVWKGVFCDQAQISLSKCVQSHTRLSNCHFRWTKVFHPYSTVLLLRLALESWRNICGKQFNLNGNFNKKPTGPSRFNRKSLIVIILINNFYNNFLWPGPARFGLHL